MVDLFDCSNRPSLNLPGTLLIHWKSTFAPLALLSCQGFRGTFPSSAQGVLYLAGFGLSTLFPELGSTIFQPAFASCLPVQRQATSYQIGFRLSRVFFGKSCKFLQGLSKTQKGRRERCSVLDARTLYHTHRGCQGEISTVFRSRTRRPRPYISLCAHTR